MVSIVRLGLQGSGNEMGRADPLQAQAKGEVGGVIQRSSYVLKHGQREEGSLLWVPPSECTP